MLRKLQTITDLLSNLRTDVWECEMLYKLVHKDLEDPAAAEYLYAKYSNPYQALTNLLKQLYREANQVAINMSHV